VAAAPGLYTYYSSGAGPAAIVNQDDVINTPQLAAVPGSIILLFATGEGQTNPPGVTGQINNSSTLPAPVLAASLTIGGKDAHLYYAGAAPGFVAGAMQINAEVPLDVTPGPNVPVQLKIGNAVSQPNVTMAVLGPDGRMANVYYHNTGSTPVQLTLYATQAPSAATFTGPVQGGFSYAVELDSKNTYGNTAGIQVGNGPIHVLSQVCSFAAGPPASWLCTGSAQDPFGN
jgi:hypothetical protein